MTRRTRQSDKQELKTDRWSDIEETLRQPETRETDRWSDRQEPQRQGTSDLRTVLVHVRQVFGKRRQSNVFLQVPQSCWINLHPLDSERLDPANLAKHTLRLRTHNAMTTCYLRACQVKCYLCAFVMWVLPVCTQPAQSKPCRCGWGPSRCCSAGGGGTSGCWWLLCSCRSTAPGNRAPVPVATPWRCLSAAQTTNIINNFRFRL